MQCFGLPGHPRRQKQPQQQQKQHQHQEPQQQPPHQLYDPLVQRAHQITIPNQHGYNGGGGSQSPYSVPVYYSRGPATMLISQVHQTVPWTPPPMYPAASTRSISTCYQGAAHQTPAKPLPMMMPVMPPYRSESLTSAPPTNFPPVVDPHVYMNIARQPRVTIQSLLQSNNAKAGRQVSTRSKRSKAALSSVQKKQVKLKLSSPSLLRTSQQLKQPTQPAMATEGVEVKTRLNLHENGVAYTRFEGKEDLDSTMSLFSHKFVHHMRACGSSSGRGMLQCLVAKSIRDCIAEVGEAPMNKVWDEHMLALKRQRSREARRERLDRKAKGITAKPLAPSRQLTTLLVKPSAIMWKQGSRFRKSILSAPGVKPSGQNGDEISFPFRPQDFAR